MHQWYWSYPDCEIFNSENELVEFDCFNLDEVIHQCSSVTSQSISDPVPTSQLNSLYDKLKLQHNHNNRHESSRLSVYSESFPGEMQLDYAEQTSLHKHLCQIDKGYDLRNSDTVGFRMFRSITSKVAIRATDELLRHVNNR